MTTNRARKPKPTHDQLAEVSARLERDRLKYLESGGNTIVAKHGETALQGLCPSSMRTRNNRTLSV